MPLIRGIIFGYQLPQLVNRYLIMMATWVPERTVDPNDPSRTVKNKIPITQWYSDIFKPLYLDRKDEAGAKHKEALFGLGWENENPILYSDYSFLEKYGLTEKAFNDLPIHHRAKLIAYNQISGLNELRTRHKEILKQNLETAKQEAAAAAAKNGKGKK